MSDDLAAEARRLYVPGVFGHKRIARQLGVSPTTVRRWLHPDQAERWLKVSREAKRRRHGKCERCGGKTRYAGAPGRAVSRFCAPCGAVIGAQYAISSRGTGSLNSRALAFLADGPKRYMEICDHLGLARDRMGALLSRLLRYGLIERPSRGLYQLTLQAEAHEERRQVQP